ncbi:MAG: hypothetical protein ABIR68_02775 [Ilumatobacteraceae bacterium]
MRFGITTSPMNTTWPPMVDAWKTADEVDIFETAWNFDHFEPIGAETWTAAGADVGIVTFAAPYTPEPLEEIATRPLARG